MKKNIVIFLYFCLIALCSNSCSEDYTPKPRGYFRIDFPKHSYKVFENDSFPYSFEMPDYSVAQTYAGHEKQPFWLDIVFAKYLAKIHLSYFKVNKNLGSYLEDSRTLAYKHAVKADAINEKLFIDPTKKVFGVLYEISGNSASSIQFYATDSTKNFLRGSLYFFAQPNKDSLLPVVNFLREDVVKFIESINWKSTK